MNPAPPPARNGETAPHLAKQAIPSHLRDFSAVLAAAQADKKLSFTHLLQHITPQALELSFWSLRQRSLQPSWQEYERTLPSRVQALHLALHANRWHAPANIPGLQEAHAFNHPNLDNLDNLVLQQAVVALLEPLYQQDFLSYAYAARQDAGANQAIQALASCLRQRKIGWVLLNSIDDIHLQISHSWLIKFLRNRILDPRLLQLLRYWITVGTQHNARFGNCGLAKSAPMTPLLINIFLHYALDLWAPQWRRQIATGDVTFIHHAGENVVAFQYDGDAHQYISAMHTRMSQFGLAFKPGAIELLSLGRPNISSPNSTTSFEFLGHTHLCQFDQTRLNLISTAIKKRRPTLNEGEPPNWDR